MLILWSYKPHRHQGSNESMRRSCLTAGSNRCSSASCSLPAWCNTTR